MASITFTLEDGTTFTTALENDLVTIGRHNESMVQLASPSVSSHHGAVRRREDGFYVQDIGSRNGTRVNGAEIEEAKLNDGDRVLFGDVQAVFSENDDVPVAMVAEAPAPKFLPTPQILAAPEPPPRAAAPGTGAPRHRITPVSRYGAVEETGGGCFMAFLLTILFVSAFLIGLFMRHYNETGGFLPGDLLDRLPKLKLEKPAE
jgi:FHA domain